MTTITNVTAYARCKATGGGNETIRILWRLGATEIESVDKTVSTVAFTDYSDSRNTDPDGNAWTVVNVDALQIGVRASALGATETITCSELWVVVTYEEGGLSVGDKMRLGWFPSRKLLGVGV